MNSIFTQNSASHITNAGILASDVALNLAGTTEDIFTDFKKIGHIIKNGKVIGTINLGGGNDHFNGGANAETVKDSDGSDVYKFGGGNDTYIALNGGAADGTDIVNGGKGIDTYDASNATAGLGINLDKVNHDFSPYDVGGFVAANTVTGTDVAAALTGKITGFENAKGGGGDDNICQLLTLRDLPDLSALAQSADIRAYSRYRQNPF